MMGKQVNPTDKAGDIPVIKYDVNGKLTLIAAGANYVLCRRPGCYPMIRTEREWRALSDTPPVWAAAEGENAPHEINAAFSINRKRGVSDQSKPERS